MAYKASPAGCRFVTEAPPPGWHSVRTMWRCRVHARRVFRPDRACTDQPVGSAGEWLLVTDGEPPRLFLRG